MITDESLLFCCCWLRLFLGRALWSRATCLNLSAAVLVAGSTRLPGPFQNYGPTWTAFRPWHCCSVLVLNNTDFTILMCRIFRWFSFLLFPPCTVFGQMTGRVVGMSDNQRKHNARKLSTPMKLTHRATAQEQKKNIQKGKQWNQVKIKTDSWCVFTQETQCGLGGNLAGDAMILLFLFIQV